MTYAWEADANTIALYHCDDGSGTNVNDTIAAWDMTATNDTNLWAGTGKFGADGLYIDAARWLTSPVNILGTDLANGTMELWIKPDVNYNAAYAGTALYIFYVAGGGGDSSLRYDTTNNCLLWHHKGNNAVFKDLTSTTATFTAGTWYHLCCTWGAAGIKLYVNGSQEDSDASTLPIESTATDQFIIGVFDNAQCFDGTVDEIRISNNQRDGSTEREAAAGTNFQINIGDVWKAVAAMQINIGDVWKAVAGAKVNIGDVWKTVF